MKPPKVVQVQGKRDIGLDNLVHVLIFYWPQSTCRLKNILPIEVFLYRCKSSPCRARYNKNKGLEFRDRKGRDLGMEPVQSERLPHFAAMVTAMLSPWARKRQRQ